MLPDHCALLRELQSIGQRDRIVKRSQTLVSKGKSRVAFWRYRLPVSTRTICAAISSAAAMCGSVAQRLNR